MAWSNTEFRGSNRARVSLVVVCTSLSAACVAAQSASECVEDCGVCGRCDDGQCQYDARAAAQPDCAAEREDPCDGRDNDGDGVVDEPPTCWSPVYAFSGARGTLCLGDGADAPAGCLGEGATAEAPLFWLASHPIPATVAVRQCSLGDDHVFVSDWATATAGYAGTAISEPAAGWEALGYRCGPVLGYAWGDTPELAGAALPLGSPCRLTRHVAGAANAEHPLGLHDTTLGAAAALPGAACEASQRYVVLSRDTHCDGGDLPAACLLAPCPAIATGALVAPGGDDPIVAPGERFTHTFRLRNTGQLSWAPSWVITPESPERIGEAPIPLGAEVAPGAETALVVTTTAPLVGVDVRDDWALRPSPGAPPVVALPFEFDVATNDVATLGWVLPGRWQIVPTNHFFFVELELGSVVDNDGWAGDWTLVREEGVLTRSPLVPLPTTLNPGGGVRFRIPAITPLEAGTYGERWHLERPDGSVAPVDGAASFAFSVQVVSEDRALLLAETFPDGTSWRAGTSFVKTWLVRNAGDHAWAPGWTLRHVAGDLAYTEDVTVDVGLEPGDDWLLVVPLRVPADDAGANWLDLWELRSASGRLITVLSLRAGGERDLHDRTGAAGERGWLWAAIDRAAACDGR